MSAQAVGGAVGKNEKRNKNSIFMPIRENMSRVIHIFLKNTLTTIYVLLIMDT